jgi:alpha-beta hydrolase superfamily lysophospholipase
MAEKHRRIKVRVDVSRAAGLEGVETAATVHLPTSTPRALVFAFPGRGYSREYYDLDLAGEYSQAAHHAARGLVLIACDHLGVGESSVPDLNQLTMEQVAAANHATVDSILERVRTGSLAKGVDPIENRFVVGMGQSMGGCLLTVQQARHRTFDAVAILGWSGHQTVLPVPAGATPLPLPGVNRGADPSTYPPRAYTAADLRYAYHWEDVPESIAVRDTEWAVGRGAGTMPGWRSATGPEVSRTMLSPGVVAHEAAAIAAPVFLGIAERDVCPDPHREPSAYRSARDITLFIQPRAAHMHNFAGTRQMLWDRVAKWIEAFL